MVQNISFIGKVRISHIPILSQSKSEVQILTQSQFIIGGPKHTTSQESSQNPHQLNSCRATATANYSAAVTGLLARCRQCQQVINIVPAVRCSAEIVTHSP